MARRRGGDAGYVHDDTDAAAAEPTASPDPLSELPLSPLPLEPTGDWGMAEANRVRKVRVRRKLRSCIVNVWEREIRVGACILNLMNAGGFSFGRNHLIAEVHAPLKRAAAYATANELELGISE